MILIASVDDNMGLMFNHRRQSRARLLLGRQILAAGQRQYDGEQKGEYGTLQLMHGCIPPG